MAKKKENLTRDDVLEQALDDIRGKFGDGAIMRMGDRSSAAIPVISTGVLPLDVALRRLQPRAYRRARLCLCGPLCCTPRRDRLPPCAGVLRRGA